MAGNGEKLKRWQFSIYTMLCVLTIAGVGSAIAGGHLWLLLTGILAVGGFWAVFGMPIVVVLFAVTQCTRLLFLRLQRSDP